MATTSTLALAQDSSAQPNWGGLYFGGSYGLAGTHVKGNYVLPPTTDRHDSSGTSQFRSGFVGLQHQFGQFVLGAEVNYGGIGFGDDWDASSRGASASCLQSLVGVVRDCRSRIDSTWTVGPRIGYAPSNKWLLFATGGYAAARIDTSTFSPTTNTEITRTSHGHSGWFAGGGLEYSYSANWSVGLEYQHLSFDTERHFTSQGGGCCTVNGDTRDIRGDENVIRMRTTFKLNRPEPVAEPMK